MPKQVTPTGLDLTIELDRNYDENRDGSLVELRPGDVVGRTIGDPFWSRVDADLQVRLGATRQVIVVRPDHIDSRFLIAFLRSDAAAVQLEIAAEGSAIPRVSPKALRTLLVPEDVSAGTATHSDEVIRMFRTASHALANDLEGRYRSAFDRATADEVRGALADAVGEASMALDLLRRASDPLHRARQFLPHPLARTLRSYENDLQSGIAHDIYGDLLRFGETTITLLGIVGLSYLTLESVDVEDSREWHRNLNRAGISLGTWLAVANAGARAARDRREPLGGLAVALSTSSPLNRTLDGFLNERNDQAHGAGPRSPHEYEQRILVLQERLTSALEELAPLSRSEWFIVTSLRWSGARRSFTVLGRSLMGDHPDFSSWESERQEPLEHGVVTARLGGLDLALGGFCQLRACPTCLNEELYYPDRVRGSMARLRSLDRGHQLEVTATDFGLPAPVGQMTGPQ
jgi:hypothetical protein